MCVKVNRPKSKGTQTSYASALRVEARQPQSVANTRRKQRALAVQKVFLP